MKYSKLTSRSSRRMISKAVMNSRAFENLEQRQMLSLLGVSPSYPKMALNSVGTLNYDSAADSLSFDINAYPFTIKMSESASTRPIKNSSMALQISVDTSGKLLGGAAGDDLVISGDAYITSLTTPDYSGVLLKGEVIAFGYLDSGGTTDQYDFRFNATGGALLPFYSGKDIGISITSESSTFADSFLVDFTGKAKGDIGPIEKLPSLGNFVWHDLNANGIQDVSEPGIKGVTVNLLASDNTTILNTTTTDDDGIYKFENLTPNYPYGVSFATPSGYIPTLANQGSNDAIDSDGTLITGITLTGSQYNDTIDSGFYKLAEIGDYVWLDKNANGIQDSGEAGISGVNVTLLDAANNPITSIPTDSTGYYVFSGLIPGKYSVAFETPFGLVPTAANVGADDTIDSDSISGQSGQYTLVSGDSNMTVDAGFYKLAEIGDYVWLDKNANGIQDSGEAGISGVNVTLLDASNNPITSIPTDSTGYYVFSGLIPGKYSVAFETPFGLVPTAANIGADDTIDSDSISGQSGQYTLNSGDSNMTVDAGFYKLAEIGDYVWLDKNANGIQDSGEAGISGVNVTLLDASNNPITSIPTDSTGYYVFSGLIPGKYSVAFETPFGLVPTAANVGADDTIDSDSVAGQSGQYTLNSGDSNMTVDAGFYQLASLGDFVWHDVNANGIQDDGEVGITGATVNLTGGATPLSTTTDANGLYSFNNLIPGVAYTVQFVMPLGYTFASERQKPGSDPSEDSDGPVSDAVILASGENNSTIDAGFYKSTPGPVPGLISGHKYLDVTGNGKSADDLANPLAGVTIQLYKDVNNDGKITSADGAAIATTTTDSAGYYQFAVETPGNYLVKEVVTTGYIRTFPLYNDYYSTSLAAGDNKDNFDFVNAEKCCKEQLSGIYFVVSGSWGTKTVSDLRGATHPGDTVTAYFTVKSTVPPTVPPVSHVYSLVSYTAPDNYFVAEHASLQRIYDAATGSFASGNYSLTVTIPNSCYQIDFVCGFPIDVLGAPNTNIFYTPQDRLFSADNSGNNSCCMNSSIITGHVYLDSNLSGVFDFGDSGISGANVTLTGTDYTGASVSKTATTGANGFYSFTGLKSGTYKVTETQPAGYTDSADNLGSLPFGILGNDVLSNIVLPASATGYNYNFGEIKKGSISGTVYLDCDKDGVMDCNEAGLEDVTIQLQNSAGSVIATTTTDENGNWSFTGLDAGLYSVVEIQPDDFQDGADKAGSLGGKVTNDKISEINIPMGAAGVNYLFGEQLSIDKLNCGDTATIGFWANCNGQKLLTNLNNSSCATNLGNWMATTFPKLYSSLAGKTNSQIASLFKTLKNASGQKLEAQLMAVVFALYVTDSDLAGYSASRYGFDISSSGTAAKFINVGSNGAAFGVANNTYLAILQVIQIINNKATGSAVTANSLFGSNTSLKNAVNTLLCAINETGDIA